MKEKGGESHEKTEAGCRDGCNHKSGNAVATTSWERQGSTPLPPELLWEWALLTGGSTPDSSTGSPHLSHHLLLLPSQGPKVYLLRGWTGQQLEAWQALGLGACSSPEQLGRPNSDPGACVQACCPGAKHTFFAVNKSKPSLYKTVRNTGKMSHK